MLNVAIEQTPKNTKNKRTPLFHTYEKYLYGLYKNAIPLLSKTQAYGPKLHGINDIISNNTN